MAFVFLAALPQIQRQQEFDVVAGVLEFAESKGIVEKTGTRYKFPDEVASVFAKHVYEKPEEYFTESIMEKIEEAVAEEFKYGQ